MKKMYVMPQTEVVKINACELMQVAGQSGFPDGPIGNGGGNGMPPKDYIIP